MKDYNILDGVGAIVVGVILSAAFTLVIAILDLCFNLPL